MKKLAAVLVLALAACGKGHTALPPLAKIAIPAGAALKPWDAAHPGRARPQNLVQVGDDVFVVLNNSSGTLAGHDYALRGPGVVAHVVPGTGTTTLIDLGGSDGHQCVNAGPIRADSGKVYVACSGADFSGTGADRALDEIDPASGAVSRRVVFPSGIVPSSLALVNGKIWVGDSLSGSLMSVDRASFQVVDGATAAHPAVTLNCAGHNYTYIPELTSMGGDLYALCANDNGGMLFRLDAATGAEKAHVAVGASPIETVPTNDGRLAVLNSNDNTLDLISVAGAGLSSQTALTLAHASALQDLKVRDHFLFTVSSGTNTVQKIDLTAAGGPKVVAEVQTGDNTNPYGILPLDDNEVLVTNWLTDEIVSANLTATTH